MQQTALIFAAPSIIGALLMVSAWTKFRDPLTFLKIIGEYPVFAGHPGAALAAGRSIPWVELALGLLLLSSHADLTRLGFCGALAFLGLATLALAQRAARGERKITCGCGGDADEAHSVAFLLLRNCLLLAIAIAGLLQSRPLTSLQPVDVTAVSIATGFGTVLTFKLLRAAWAAREAANEWRVAG